MRALGLITAWGRGAAAIPTDSRAAARGRRVLGLGRPEGEYGGDRFRRATRECLWALASVDAMLQDERASREEIAGDRTALVFVSAAAYAASNRAFIEGKGGAMHFAYTAPAVMPAEVAIEFGLTGPLAVFLGGAPATLRAIWHGAELLRADVCDRALVLAVEIFEECADGWERARRLVSSPLVEAAGCLWLERGGGWPGLEHGIDRVSGPLKRRVGETLACEPLVALDLWRYGGGAGRLLVGGRWQGERAELSWPDALGAVAG
jgi:hypothetical protein